MNRLIEHYTIPCYDTDASWRLKPVSFMNYAQEMANRHASVLGFGYDDLIGSRTAWVLARMYIRFIDLPLWRNDVTLTTWHKGLNRLFLWERLVSQNLFMVSPCSLQILNRLFFLRDFRMTDQQGNVRVEATTSWIVLNLDTRRLVRDPKLMDEGTKCSENAVEQPADKVQLPKDAQMEFVMEHTVSYSDVDLLGHTNNAMYMHWAMDAVPYEITSQHPLKEVTINFNHETRAGEKVSIYRTSLQAEDGLRVFIEGKVGDTSSFVIEMLF